MSFATSFLKSSHGSRSGATLTDSASVLAVVAVFAACSSAPIAPSSRPPRETASSPAKVIAPLDRDGLALTPLVTLQTGSDTPSPAFGGGGRWLVYRAEGGDPRHHDESSEIHILSLQGLEDRIAYAYQATQSAYGYDYAPYGSVPSGPTQDVAFHPAMMGRSVVMGGAALLPSYMEDGVADAFRLAPDGEDPAPFGSSGTLPRVSPDESRVLLHTAAGIVVSDASGARLSEFPGHFGVWAPDGRAFLAHITPYLVPDLFAGSIDWTPYQIEPSWENAGGLVLVHDGEVEQLTGEGGAPSWFPDGTAFIYEKPRLPADRTSAALVRFAMADRSESTWVEEGWQPAVHPGGHLVFFESSQGVSVADADGARLLGVDGSEPLISPDGNVLCVQLPRLDRRGRQVVDLALYVLH